MKYILFIFTFILIENSFAQSKLSQKDYVKLIEKTELAIELQKSISFQETSVVNYLENLIILGQQNESTMAIDILFRSYITNKKEYQKILSQWPSKNKKQLKELFDDIERLNTYGNGN